MQTVTEGLAIDVETTGLNIENNEIVEIGLIAFDKEFNFLDSFRSYIRPEKEWSIQPKAMEINGLSIEFLRKQPRKFEVNRFLLDWLLEHYNENKISLMGHSCLTLDIPMFSNLIGEENFKKFFNRTVRDSKIFAQGLIDSNKINVLNSHLKTLCNEFGIKFGEHTALGDAQATLNCYKTMINL